MVQKFWERIVLISTIGAFVSRNIHILINLLRYMKPPYHYSGNKYLNNFGISVPSKKSPFLFGLTSIPDAGFFSNICKIWVRWLQSVKKPYLFNPLFLSSFQSLFFSSFQYPFSHHFLNVLIIFYHNLYIGSSLNTSTDSTIQLFLGQFF